MLIFDHQCRYVPVVYIVSDYFQQKIDGEACGVSWKRTLMHTCALLYTFTLIATLFKYSAARFSADYTFYSSTTKCSTKLKFSAAKSTIGLLDNSGNCAVIRMATNAAKCLLKCFVIVS